MDFRTWIVWVDHEAPLHDFERPLVEIIGQESELSDAARRHEVSAATLFRLVNGLRHRGILKLENRPVS
jgi:hypothetical protein